MNTGSVCREVFFGFTILHASAWLALHSTYGHDYQTLRQIGSLLGLFMILTIEVLLFAVMRSVLQQQQFELRRKDESSALPQYQTSARAIEAALFVQ